MPDAADVVREQFEAVNRRDFARAMELYAEDVELAAPERFATGRNVVGKDAVGRWFGDWLLGTFRDPHFDILEIHDAGDRVMLAAHHTATGKSSGIEVESDFFYAYWVRDGLVARVEFHESRRDALDAIGLSD